jgi:hypothetical protein
MEDQARTILFFKAGHFSRKSCVTVEIAKPFIATVRLRAGAEPGGKAKGLEVTYANDS